MGNCIMAVSTLVALPVIFVAVMAVFCAGS